MKVTGYYHYAGGNYGKNALKVEIGNNSFYFSYKTCIAFTFGGKLYISENLWGPTTGKHLNSIDRDKKKRMKREDFEAKLKSIESGIEQIEFDI